MSGSIPESLDGLESLENLGLITNQFTGSLPELMTLPTHSLQRVLLQFNDFEGSLPTMKPQSELQYLVLSENSKMTGTIPDTFYSQPDLEWVSFRNTGIGGTLSPRMDALASLGFVWWQDAAFSGSLPSSRQHAEATLR